MSAAVAAALTLVLVACKFAAEIFALSEICFSSKIYLYKICNGMCSVYMCVYVCKQLLYVNAGV